MSEHRCKNCKNGNGNTCTLTGACHDTGIECPSFEIKKKQAKLGPQLIPSIAGHAARVFNGHPEGVLEVKEDIERGPHGYCLECQTKIKEAKNGDVVLMCGKCQPFSHFAVNKPLIRMFESGAKDTNPKDALGVKKVPLSTMPTGPMYEVSLAMLEGARKYGRHNYRTLGVKASVYYDAALRHLTTWWEGEDIDEASGIHHLMKAAACLFVVRDSMLMENWIDDRPPQYPEKLDAERLNKLAQEMITKYPTCVKPFCHKESTNENDL